LFYLVRWTVVVLTRYVVLDVGSRWLFGLLFVRYGFRSVGSVGLRLRAIIACVGLQFVGFLVWIAVVLRVVPLVRWLWHYAVSGRRLVAVYAPATLPLPLAGLLGYTAVLFPITPSPLVAIAAVGLICVLLLVRLVLIQFFGLFGSWFLWLVPRFCSLPLQPHVL